MTFNGNHNSRIYSPDPPPREGMLTRVGDWVKQVFRIVPQEAARPEPTVFPLLNDELNEARARRSAQIASSGCDSQALSPVVNLYSDRTSRPGH